MSSSSSPSACSSSAADGLLDPVAFALRQSALSLFAYIAARDTERIRATLADEPRVAHTAAKFRGQEKYAVEVAALTDNGCAVEVLAAAGADLNCVQSGAPLIAAVTLRCHGALRALLAHKADPNLAPLGTDTALHHAVRLGDAAAIRMLLRAGANPSKFSVWDTPLHIACTSRRADLASLLISAGANVNAIGSLSPLQIASRNGDLDVVSLLIDAGADVNLVDGSGRSALSLACTAGHFEVSKFLLNRGADPNCARGRGEPPLLLALQRKHMPLVVLLYQRGADPNIRVHDLPHIWVSPADADTFLLLDPKINIVNSAGRTPLMAAAAHGQVAYARALLARGADVNRVAPGGLRITALHAAVLAGFADMVTLLLDWGADPRLTLEGSQPQSAIEIARSMPTQSLFGIINRRPVKLM